MNPLVRLANLTMLGRGYAGAQDLPVPPPRNPAATGRPATMDGARSERDSVKPIRDIVILPHRAPPHLGWVLDHAVAASEPWIGEAADRATSDQAGYAARGAAFDCPDPTMVRAVPNQSGLTFWSRSDYGEFDFRGNHEPLMAWVAALQAQLPPSREK
jgi:hypothetical protein